MAGRSARSGYRANQRRAGDIFRVMHLGGGIRGSAVRWIKDRDQQRGVFRWARIGRLAGGGRVAQNVLRHRCKPDSAEIAVTCERGSRTISAQMTDRPAETLLALLSKAAIRRCFARCADEPIGEESKPCRRDILSARSGAGAVTPSYTSRDPDRSPVAIKTQD
jgi:hypothetical protein